jgi:hypothetical protein
MHYVCVVYLFLIFYVYLYLLWVVVTVEGFGNQTEGNYFLTIPIKIQKEGKGCRVTSPSRISEIHYKTEES